MSGLEGLTVLEIADTLGAAFAVSLLADYGATAIVCEPPEGSKLRRLGPAAIDDARWKILARNKQSISADWASPDSAAQIGRLLAQADMLVTDLAKPQQAGNPWFTVLETIPEAERSRQTRAVALCRPAGIRRGSERCDGADRPYRQDADPGRGAADRLSRRHARGDQGADRTA
jgi:hypothetical protein